VDADELDYWRDHPNPSEEEIRELCEAWLEYQREDHDGGVDTDDPNWWAVDAMMDTELDLERSWSLIQRLCKIAAPDDPAVRMIGAAPLESLILHHGQRAMDLIEPFADRNATMFAALTNVWAFSEPVRPRLQQYLLSRG
jgi:hypothetical protein